MILYDPYSPAGMVWTREELGRIGELCAANHMKIMLDETRHDLTEPGHDYIPFASVSETCAQNNVTYAALTKVPNLAGSQTVTVMVPNEKLHHKMERVLNTDEVAEPNVFAIETAIATFTKGEG